MRLYTGLTERRTSVHPRPRPSARVGGAKGPAHGRVHRMGWRTKVAVSVLGMTVFAAPALADGTTSDIEALRRRVEEQERRLRELEGSAPTQDEIAQSVDRYLTGNGSAVLIGGADEGKAGFPMGKHPFIKEGPNKIEFYLRNQVRYEAF